MIDEGDISLSLDDMLSESARQHGFDQHDGELGSFILERLRVSLRDRGYAYDVIASVLATVPAGSCGDIRLLCRLTAALDGFLQTPDGQGLRAGWRRVASLLEAEEKKAPISARLEATLLSTGAERALYEAVTELPKLSVTSVKDIENAMHALAGLAQPINHFFDNVVVNSDDEAIRQNRLALLGQVRVAMREIADFNQLEGA